MKALVLSAGGMYGAYQAGVWKEIEDLFDPDLVVGASVGSLNAWRIAGGCSGTSLCERWLSLGDATALQWRIPKRWSDGLIDTTALELEVKSMCSAGPPARQLGIVLTKLPSFEPVLFRTPSLAWEHVAASCAVPIFMCQYKINGHWYSDGGIVDPLPINAALAMGATEIITVNLMKHRHWPARTAVSMLRRLSGYRIEPCSHVEVLDISPDSPLGTIRESMYWKKDTAEALMERGIRDARLKRNRIVQLMEREHPKFGNLPHSSPA